MTPGTMATDFISQNLHLSPLATRIGLLCLTTQLTLTILFDERAKILPRGPWSDQPAFAAHQIVAFPWMIILAYCGWKEWEFDLPIQYGENATAMSPRDRLFGLSNPEDVPLAFGTGAILLWDIPFGVLAPSLREPLMLAHHVGMFFVAAVMGGMFSGGQMIGYYYVPFYFGVIETSSVFLSVVDQFHPKRKAWHEWLNRKHTNNATASVAKIANQLNEICRILFAVSFMLLRGMHFPFTSFAHAIPDIWKAYENRPDGVPMWTCYFLCISLFLFSCLQSYWGFLVAKQIKKALSGDGGGGKKKK